MIYSSYEGLPPQKRAWLVLEKLTCRSSLENKAKPQKCANQINHGLSEALVETCSAWRSQLQYWKFLTWFTTGSSGPQGTQTKSSSNADRAPKKDGRAHMPTAWSTTSWVCSIKAGAMAVLTIRNTRSEKMKKRSMIPNQTALKSNPPHESQIKRNQLRLGFSQRRRSSVGTRVGRHHTPRNTRFGKKNCEGDLTWDNAFNFWESPFLWHPIE